MARSAATVVRASAGMLLLGVVAVAWFELLRWAPASHRAPADDVLLAVVLVPAAWLAWRASRRRFGPRGVAVAWRLVALALTVNLVVFAGRAWYQLPVLPLGDVPVWPVLLLLAVACHEAGHAAAAHLLGLEWKPFVRFPRAAGIAVKVPRGGLRPRDDLLVALGGPIASLALAAAAFPLVPELGILSALLGLLNLVPFLRGSDGWRATRAVRRLDQASR